MEPRDSDGKFDPKASIAKVNRILDGCPDLRNCYRCGLPDLDECKCLCEGGCGKALRALKLFSDRFGNGEYDKLIEELGDYD